MGHITWKYASHSEVVMAWNQAVSSIMEGVTEYLTMKDDDLTLVVRILEIQLGTITLLNDEIEERIRRLMSSCVWCCLSRSKKDRLALQQCISNKHIVVLAQSALEQYKLKEHERQTLFRPIYRPVAIR
ncbi:MAG: hypothetical protein SP1CHLAM54_05050 [Chlamydiia bacterium]|nr:hypothetical protein [Chlamydiia bacterium]MCH9615417.1 hypothetical protein [Chlamydiia bacterium]MCH9628261.1 hypothetical protein [Chlamydiia bacterium]